MNKYLIVGVIALVIFVLGVYNIREEFTKEALPNIDTINSNNILNTNKTSQNYIVENGKIIPMTILSEEDAKKSCDECHTYK